MNVPWELIDLIPVKWIKKIILKRKINAFRIEMDLDLKLLNDYYQSLSIKKDEYERYCEITTLSGPISKMKEKPLPQWNHKKMGVDISLVAEGLSEKEHRAIRDFQGQLDKITEIISNIKDVTIAHDDAEMKRDLDKGDKCEHKIINLWEQFEKTVDYRLKKGNPLN